MQTSEQLAAFRALCKANGLGKAEVWQHKQSGNWIIGRAGIEKIQGLNNIQLDIEFAAGGVDFAVVKATAVRSVKLETSKVAKKLSVQSLGSANASNSKVSYYAEMAEKRAKSRSILMLMGFYELGVYGEEEADDFKRYIGAPTLEDVEQPTAVPGPIQPAAPEPAPLASTSPAPLSAAPNSATQMQVLPPTGREGQPADEPGKVLASAAQKENIIRLLNHPVVTRQEKTKMLLCINRLDEERADQAIANLNKSIKEREAVHGAIHPESARVAAAQELYSFVELHQATLGEEETADMLALCNAANATPDELYYAKARAAEMVMLADTAA